MVAHFGEDQLQQWLSEDCVVVHLFTDDHGYRAFYAKKFADQVADGRLKFGPIPEGERDNSNGSGSKDSWHVEFKREVSTKWAVVDFQTMARGDSLVWTTGSTVKYYVQNQHKRINSGIQVWEEEKSIGKFKFGQEASKPFVGQIWKFVGENMSYLGNYFDVPISSEQFNVLAFLSESHLKDIYDCLNEYLHEKKTRAKAADVGQHLISKLWVAQKNRQIYQKITLDPAKRTSRWLKALIETRLMHFIRCNDDCENEIHYDDVEYDILTSPRRSKRDHASSSSWMDEDSRSKRVRFWRQPGRCNSCKAATSSLGDRRVYIRQQAAMQLSEKQTLDTTAIS